MSTKPPEIDLANHPLVEQIEDSNILRRGADLFLLYGFLVIKNAFDRDFIQRACIEFTQEYEEYFHDRVYDDALQVGEKRSMISLRLKGVFDSSAFYANPRVLPLLRSLLGDDVILLSLGSVVSLPGSPVQHVHRDHPNIYSSRLLRATSAPMVVLPPYAITMGIPLVDLTEATGSTRLWPGTHLSRAEPEDLPPNSGVDVAAETGSCFLFDYRIIHSGRANRSDRVRPLLYNSYARPWFRDSRNYRTQHPLLVTDEQIRSVPKNLRHLFDWLINAEVRTHVDR